MIWPGRQLPSRRRSGPLSTPAGRPEGTPDRERLLGLQAGPVRAQALFYDGTPAAARRLAVWVEQLSPFPARGFSFGEDGVPVVSEAWSAGQVKVPPGHFLVFAQSGGDRWAVCTPGQLETWFETRPRELPIFDDGEVAVS